MKFGIRYGALLCALRHGRKQTRLQEAQRPSALKPCRLIQVWYYVMIGDDVLVERKCCVLTVERAIDRLESALKRLRVLTAYEHRCCGTCGGKKRKRTKKQEAKSSLMCYTAAPY